MATRRSRMERSVVPGTICSGSRPYISAYRLLQTTKRWPLSNMQSPWGMLLTAASSCNFAASSRWF